MKSRVKAKACHASFCAKRTDNGWSEDVISRGMGRRTIGLGHAGEKTDWITHRECLFRANKTRGQRYHWILSFHSRVRVSKHPKDWFTYYSSTMIGLPQTGFHTSYYVTVLIWLQARGYRKEQSLTGPSYEMENFIHRNVLFQYPKYRKTLTAFFTFYWHKKVERGKILHLGKIEI